MPGLPSLMRKLGRTSRLVASGPGGMSARGARQARRPPTIGTARTREHRRDNSTRRRVARVTTLL
eukprot:scaffold125604_cov31-Tisochrysis_lutea.AAC.2